MHFDFNNHFIKATRACLIFQKYQKIIFFFWYLGLQTYAWDVFLILKLAFLVDIKQLDFTWWDKNLIINENFS